MQKTPIHAAILVMLMVCSGQASPVRRQHRPWLMIGGSRPVPSASNVTSPAPVEYGPANPKDKGREVAQQALKYKGTRYRYGGTTKKGLDCSGLVSRVYEDLKMKKIPRVSASLYQSGQPIKLSELRPGDLVFFKNTSKRGISHVGVYAGHNKFVHASGHKRGVILTALSDPYYQLHYAGARRLY